MRSRKPRSTPSPQPLPPMTSLDDAMEAHRHGGAQPSGAQVGLGTHARPPPHGCAPHQDRRGTTRNIRVVRGQTRMGCAPAATAARRLQRQWASGSSARMLAPDRVGSRPEHRARFGARRLQRQCAARWKDGLTHWPGIYRRSAHHYPKPLNATPGRDSCPGAAGCQANPAARRTNGAGKFLKWSPPGSERSRRAGPRRGPVGTARRILSRSARQPG